MPGRSESGDNGIGHTAMTSTELALEKDDADVAATASIVSGPVMEGSCLA